LVLVGRLLLERLQGIEVQTHPYLFLDLLPLLVAVVEEAMETQETLLL
jgi:hypothetical protein